MSQNYSGTVVTVIKYVLILSADKEDSMKKLKNGSSNYKREKQKHVVKVQLGESLGEIISLLQQVEKLIWKGKKGSYISFPVDQVWH